MNLLDDVRLSLRLTQDIFDSEIQDIIDACKRDLILSGVSASIVNRKRIDPLIKRAITLYSKGHFGYADITEKYLQSYEMLKISLCLAGDYNGSGGDTP
jgi:hypothetical protein